MYIVPKFKRNKKCIYNEAYSSHSCLPAILLPKLVLLISITLYSDIPCKYKYMNRILESKMLIPEDEIREV